MPLQFVKQQIKNNQIDATKMDLSSGQTFDFSNLVTLVAEPIASTSAATKNYVDNVANGLYWKAPVEVATIANITLAGAQTIDGVAVVAGDRVLVRSQTDGAENGIYICVDPGAWTRSEDMNAGSEFPGAAVFTLRGTTHADAGFVCSNDVAPTLGTTAIAFVQFTGAGQITAGDGLVKNGNVMSVDLVASDSGLTFTGGKLEVEDLGLKLEKQGWENGYEEFTTSGQLTFTLTSLTTANAPAEFRNSGNIKVFRNGQLQRSESGAGQPTDDNGYNITVSGSDVNVVIKDGFPLVSGEIVQVHYVKNA